MTIAAQKLKILISAYACEPGRGSEPEVGWQWAVGLGSFHDVTVLTRSNNRDRIEEGCAALSEDARPQFIYYDLPKPLRLMKKAGMPVGLYYLLWQIGAAFKIRALRRRFDIVQHLTFNSFLLPGFLWFRAPAVVLGPLGGGMVTSRKHLGHFGLRAPWEMLRSLLVMIGAWNPLLLLSFLRARLILAANEETERRVPYLFRHKVRRLLETAAPVHSVVSEVSSGKDGKRGSFLWIGSLEERKAPGLALRSFAQVAARHADATLTVVGTGPLAGKLQQLAKKLCVEGRVKFVGKLEKEKVLDLLAEHTALLFTSVRDTSGNVVLEAMSEGVPVIAFRHQGVKEIMDSRSGIFVEPHGGQIDEQGFTEAMDRLISNPEETRAMGVHAMGEAQGRLSWGKKWSAVTPIYSNLMAARLSK